MKPQTRDSSLLPVGLPLFVLLVIATLVLSMSNILLGMTVETAPFAALGISAGILVMSSFAALASKDDAFYVQLVGVLIVLAIVTIGFVMGINGHHPEQAAFIPLGIVAAGIVGLTIMPRGVVTEEEFAEREKIPARPIIGIAILFAVAVGVTVFGFIRENQAEETVTATATPTVSETVVGTSTPAADGRRIALSAGDNFFDPATVTAAPNENIVLEVTNTGAAVHNLAIDGGPKVDLVGPGQSADLPFTAPASGEVGFKCEFHPEMVGTITIQ